MADLDEEMLAAIAGRSVATTELSQFLEDPSADWARIQPFHQMPAGFNFDELELSTRARNCIGRYPKAWLREATIADLARIPQLGRKTLVELLEAYDSVVDGVGSAPSRRTEGIAANPPAPGGDHRPARRSASQRVKEMYSVYEAGATLEEVAEQSGLTRERIRQLFCEAGLKVRSIGETAALKRKALGDSNRDRIINAFEGSNTAKMIAGELGLPLRIVGEVLAEDPRRARLMSARSHAKRNGGPRYSNEDLIDCLRTASLAIGGVLTTAGYSALARTQAFPDGRPWPTHQTPSNRFGGWRAALQQAGLESNPPSAIAGQRIFTRGHCIDAILEVERALGRLPTAADYEEYATKMGGAIPSLATVRNRCGSWRDALRLAVEFS